ncbi:MAG: hypothetical protein ABSE93_27325 [Terriglobia bacterium]|jgi:hypothetical protein
MNRRKPEKDFDCIGFKRKVQAEIYEEIRGLSREEQIEYFRRRAADGPLGKWWKALERRSGAAAGKEVSSTATGSHQLILSSSSESVLEQGRPPSGFSHA